MATAAAQKPPEKKKVPFKDFPLTVPPALVDLTIGEFVSKHVRKLRPTAVLVTPYDRTLPWKLVCDMPLAEFLKHCRGWHMARHPGGTQAVEYLSEALAEHGIPWWG